MEMNDRKTAVQMWLGIANIVLTVIIGIVLAVVFRIRDERLQKEMVGLNVEAERKANLAHLEFRAACPDRENCSGGIEVWNSGPAAATNVRVVILLDWIDQAWAPVVDDTGRLRIITSPPVVNVGITNTRVEVVNDLQTMSGNNAVELTVDTLQPDGAFRVLFEPADSVPLETHQVTRTTTLYAPGDGTTHVEYDFDSLLKRYFEEEFRVARFKASSTCENCDSIEENFEVGLSSLQEWECHMVDRQESVQGFGWNAILHLTYRMPQGSGFASIPSPLYLRATFPDDSGQPSVYEATPILGYHMVQRGETLPCIARAYGVNPWAIAAQNNILDPETMYQGMVLAIPYAYATLSPGRRCDPQFELYQAPAVSCRVYHVVRPDESLLDISLSYGVSMWAIAEANEIFDVNDVRPGDTLCIP